MNELVIHNNFNKSTITNQNTKLLAKTLWLLTQYIIIEENVDGSQRNTEKT